MSGYRFCVHVVTAGFLAAAGSAALSGLAATAAAEPSGGGSHDSGSHDSGSHESSRSHAGSNAGGHSAGHSAGSGSSESAGGASATQKSKTAGSSGSAAGVSSGHGAANTGTGSSGGAQVAAGADTAGHSVTAQSKEPGARRVDAPASAANGDSIQKPVTKTRALTDPKPSTSGISGASGKPAASPVTGVAGTAGSTATQQAQSTAKPASPSISGSGSLLPDHRNAAATTSDVNTDHGPLGDVKLVQPNAIQKNEKKDESSSSVPSAHPDSTEQQLKQAGIQTPNRESNHPGDRAITDAGGKTADTTGPQNKSDKSTVAPGTDRAVTSTVHITQNSPAASALTDATGPAQVASVQVPTRPSLTARAQTLTAPATVATAAVTAPTAPAPAPVAPVGPPPVPAVPANAPTTPGGGTTASITSALADVRKRDQGSGDTVTQEPVNTEQTLHVQNAANTTQAVGTGDDSTLTSTEALAGVAAAAAQDPENVPRVRVARDTSSVAGAADDAGLTDAAQVAQIRGTFLTKATELGADRAQLVADSTALREKHDALTAERQKFETELDKHNKNLATVNADDATIARDNAALTADILAHNAAVAAGGGSNANAAALAVRQAALNARIIANNQAKLKYNIEAAQLNSQQASINARADENLAEGIRLQQRAQEFGTRVTQLTDDLGRALEPYKKGSGRADAITDVINAIKLSQREAAQAAEATSKAAFGGSGGIATLPDGTMMILPRLLPQRVAMQVSPEGVISIFKGDLTQFVKYLPDVIG